jgi:predicted Zn-dependent peptidase
MNRLMPPAAQRRRWDFPMPSTWSLGDRITAVHCALPGQELVSVEFVLRAPMHEEPAGFDGVFYALAAAIAAGPRVDSDEQFDRVLGIHGASVAVIDDIHSVRLRLVCPVDEIRGAIAAFSRALRAPDLSPPRVRGLSNHLSKRQLVEATQDLGPVEARAQLLGTECRYGRPRLGTSETLLGITADSLSSVADKILRPPGLSVVAAGDLSEVVVDDILGEHFGGWSDRGGPTGGWVPSVSELPSPPRDLIEVTGPSGPQAQVLLAALGPRPDDVSWPALLAAVHQLGGAQMSVLDRVLRENHGYTFGVQATLDAVGPVSVIMIRTMVAAGLADEALERLLATLAELQAEGFSAAGRVAAIRSLRDAAPRQLQTSRAVAGTYAEALGQGLGVGYPRRLHSRLARVTTDQMSTALNYWLSPERRVAVVVRPQS